MKQLLVFSAIGLAALFLIAPCLHAQRTVYWKGGTPGSESNWNVPGNWSHGAVPDAFCDVVIPDVSTRTGVYPVLSQKVVVNNLTLESGAALVVQTGGRLEVEGTLACYGLPNLDVRGLLVLKNDAQVAGLFP